MQHEVLFFSPHFIDDTLNTRAECVRDSLICKKYMFLAKIFALRSMGIQLVPSPLKLQPNVIHSQLGVISVMDFQTQEALHHQTYTKDKAFCRSTNN